MKNTITFREATTKDIPQIQFVRNAVKENKLSNPGLVTDQHCEEFLTVRGKGWVCEADDQILGFAIADLQEDNIWALFVHPDYERKGIGKQLQEKMLDWYFSQGKAKVWLSTTPWTRAERFYRKSGWRELGKYGVDQIKFELTAEVWEKIKQSRGLSKS